MPSRKSRGGGDAGGVVGGGDFVGVAVDFGAGVGVEAEGLAVRAAAMGFGRVAEEDAELAAHFGEGAAEEAAVGEGAEVARAVVAAQAGEAEAGEGFALVEADEEEAFVVDEVGVVFGAPVLDEFAFEEEGLGLGADFDDVEVAHEGDHGGDFGLVEIGAATALEIGGDAFFEILGFADVEDGAETVLHQVNAGRWGSWRSFSFSREGESPVGALAGGWLAVDMTGNEIKTAAFLSDLKWKNGGIPLG